MLTLQPLDLEKAATEKPKPGQFNSTQLNIVSFIDVQKAIAMKSLDGNVRMTDNGLNSINQGTAELKTTCKQGQVINWLVYPLDMEKRIDGTWPPMGKIKNIVFLNDGGDVARTKVCTEFKIYGGPDKIYSKWTPAYYYWAAMVLPDLPIGIYKYRLIFELDTLDAEAQYLNMNTYPSLNVIPMDAGR